MNKFLLVLGATLLSFSLQASPRATVTCHPVKVTSWGDGADLQCGDLRGPITPFAAVAISGRVLPGMPDIFFTALTQRFLDLSISALERKKSVTIEYEPADTSGPSYGCPLSNCRPCLKLTVNE